MFGAFPFYRSPCDPDRVRALAAQRARRAQWLPDEYDDDDDDYRLHPHERAYLTAHRKHTQMERGQQRREQEEAEAARCRALEERKQQQELGKRQAEEQKRCRQQGLVFQTPIHPHTSPVADCNTPSNRKQYTEKHVEAASVLQRLFRIRQSIHTIQSLISEFSHLGIQRSPRKFHLPLYSFVPKSFILFRGGHQCRRCRSFFSPRRHRPQHKDTKIGIQFHKLRSPRLQRCPR